MEGLLNWFVKNHGSNINLHPLTIRLLNPGKIVLKKDYEFDEEFDIFDEIDNICYVLNVYNPRTIDKINTRKWNAKVCENYGMETNWYAFYSYCC